MKIQRIKLVYNKHCPNHYDLMKYAQKVSRMSCVEFAHMQYPGKTTLQVSGFGTVECYESPKVIREFLHGLEHALWKEARVK